LSTSLNCSKCGKSLDYAAHLSETFGYDGGCMVFECECSNEIKRDFIPLDLLDQKQQIKILLKNTELDEETQKIALLYYKKNKSFKKKLENLSK